MKRQTVVVGHRMADSQGWIESHAGQIIQGLISLIGMIFSAIGGVVYANRGKVSTGQMEIALSALKTELRHDQIAGDGNTFDKQLKEMKVAIAEAFISHESHVVHPLERRIGALETKIDDRVTRGELRDAVSDIQSTLGDIRQDIRNLKD